MIGSAITNGPQGAGGAGGAPVHAIAPAAQAAEGAWKAVSAALRVELGADLFASWIAPARLYETGAAVILAVHTETARDWIKRNAWRRMVELWASNDRSHRPLVLRSRAETQALTAPVPAMGVEPEEAPRAAPASITPIREDVTPDANGRVVGLQERFSFDNFVGHASNEFALTVAKKVGGWADGCFNSVLVHGPYGFGKTHLLHAIGWAAHRARPDRKVVYLTAEQFLSNFVSAVRAGAGASFKGDIRSADLLLIDDVQFIGGKTKSQDELYHALVSLMGEGRRVVFAADRPPSAITEIDARLRSHLGAGLVCGIERADRDMRMDVLDRKLTSLAQQLGVQGPARPEVMAMLADRFPDSIRELEGGLNTLAVRAGERLSTLTLEEAETFLRPHLQRGGDRKVTVDEIQKAVAEHYLLKQADLLSERRTRAVARPRQLAMYLA
ncbi:MAG: DnaA/Hda family protein, partial [Pseudomonadota bacterium]|nr:DnaA/Hda family protein [Pseudomonadota bacterium]